MERRGSAARRSVSPGLSGLRPASPALDAALSVLRGMRSSAAASTSDARGVRHTWSGGLEPGARGGAAIARSTTPASRPLSAAPALAARSRFTSPSPLPVARARPPLNDALAATLPRPASAQGVSAPGLRWASPAGRAGGRATAPASALPRPSSAAGRLTRASDPPRAWTPSRAPAAVTGLAAPSLLLRSAAAALRTVSPELRPPPPRAAPLRTASPAPQWGAAAARARTSAPPPAFGSGRPLSASGSPSPARALPSRLASASAPASQQQQALARGGGFGRAALAVASGAGGRASGEGLGRLVGRPPSPAATAAPSPAAGRPSAPPSAALERAAVECARLKRLLAVTAGEVDSLERSCASLRAQLQQRDADCAQLGALLAAVHRGELRAEQLADFAALPEAHARRGVAQAQARELPRRRSAFDGIAAEEVSWDSPLSSRPPLQRPATVPLLALGALRLRSSRDEGEGGGLAPGVRGRTSQASEQGDSASERTGRVPPRPASRAGGRF